MWISSISRILLAAGGPAQTKLAAGGLALLVLAAVLNLCSARLSHRRHDWQPRSVSGSARQRQRRS
jgi:hypothetical protein